MLYEDENKMVIGELWHEHEEDDPTIECALCGAEVDEETTTYGICEKCWTDAHTFDNALAYGAAAHVKVSIHAPPRGAIAKCRMCAMRGYNILQTVKRKGRNT